VLATIITDCQKQQAEDTKANLLADLKSALDYYKNKFAIKC